MAADDEREDREEAGRPTARLSPVEPQAEDEDEGPAGGAPGARAPERDALFDAVAVGNASAVVAALDAGVPPESIDEAEGYSALELAAGLGHVEAARALLARGAPPDLGVVQTPLQAAAGQGRAELAHLLIASGADPRAAGEEGITPLMAAATSGHLGIIEELLAAGADAGARSEAGETALFCAGVNGHRDAHALLARAAPLSADDARRAAEALARATEAAAAPPEPDDAGRIDAELAARGARDVRIENGLYVIDFPWGEEAGELYTAAENGYTTVVRALLRDGARVDDRELFTGHSALMRAAIGGKADTVRFLLDAGADPRAADGDGNTALIHAVALPTSREARPERRAIVEALIEGGADPDAANARGETAIALAAGWNELEAVEALLAGGASVPAAVHEQARHNERLAALLSGPGAEPV